MLSLGLASVLCIKCGGAYPGDQAAGEWSTFTYRGAKPENQMDQVSHTIARGNCCRHVWRDKASLKIALVHLASLSCNLVFVKVRHSTGA
jgi:hypothetical protein